MAGFVTTGLIHRGEQRLRDSLLHLTNDAQAYQPRHGAEQGEELPPWGGQSHNLRVSEALGHLCARVGKWVEVAAGKTIGIALLLVGLSCARLFRSFLMKSSSPNVETASKPKPGCYTLDARRSGDSTDGKRPVNAVKPLETVRIMPQPEDSYWLSVNYGMQKRPNCMALI